MCLQTRRPEGRDKRDGGTPHCLGISRNIIKVVQGAVVWGAVQFPKAPRLIGTKSSIVYSLLLREYPLRYSFRLFLQK